MREISMSIIRLTEAVLYAPVNESLELGDGKVRFVDTWDRPVHAFDSDGLDMELLIRWEGVAAPGVRDGAVAWFGMLAIFVARLPFQGSHSLYVEQSLGPVAHFGCTFVSGGVWHLRHLTQKGTK